VIGASDAAAARDNPGRAFHRTEDTLKDVKSVIHVSRQNDADGGFKRADAAIGNRPGLRFLLALILLSLAAFAAAFRASLTWWYRQVFAASNVVEAITGLPWWLRLLMPLAGGLAAGVLSRLRGAPNQGVSNVMEAVVLGTIQLRVRDDGARGCIMDRHRNRHVHRSEGPLLEFGEQSARLLPAIAATVIATAVTRAIVGPGLIYGQRGFAFQSGRTWRGLVHLG
jgi:H+/Cl- antiporter ClcA